MLNVRSFLDHNRIYCPPKDNYADNKCTSTGAFAYRGRWIPNYELKQNLIEHFKCWTDYVSKYGLLVLELHTISPILTANHLGKSVATAYDATHGFSDQYLIEHNIFINILEQLGMRIDLKNQSLFPDNINTMISVNYIK